MQYAAAKYRDFSSRVKFALTINLNAYRRYAVQFSPSFENAHHQHCNCPRSMQIHSGRSFGLGCRFPAEICADFSKRSSRLSIFMRNDAS